jgi:S-sulfosulfanyl-L-cysteine sulfohydrolase
MSMNRREFMQVLAVAAAAGMPIGAREALAQQPGAAARMYELPRFGNVHLLHFTDCHAQLLPIYFREPSVNLGVADAVGKPPHLVGEHLLRHFGIQPKTIEAHAFTFLDFEAAARTYGKVGGFAHLATLVKRLKASRPGALLLDGGDTWQGSGHALWTNAQDMVDACKLLGVDVMTAHWEITYGMERVKEIVERDFKGKIDFVAQNVVTATSATRSFRLHDQGDERRHGGDHRPGLPVHADRQPAPPGRRLELRHPGQDHAEVGRRGARQGRAGGVVLSHNGMDVDLKMASRVRGIDAIMGGHTHDGVPAPVDRQERRRPDAGHQRRQQRQVPRRARLRRQGRPHGRLPLQAAAGVRQPAAGRRRDGGLHREGRARRTRQAAEKLATTEGLLYRRGNFNGTFDQVICDALMAVKGADIAFSPGFRWGTSLLPGQDILMEHVLDQTSLTYPATTLTDMSGEMLKTVLEDVADNLFNPDPYLQQGGDMVRVGGLAYSIEPMAAMGKRVNDMTLAGKPIEPNRNYKVAGWASVQEGVTGEPIWDVVAKYLRDQKALKAPKLNQPVIKGMKGNPGLA